MSCHHGHACGPSDSNSDDQIVCEVEIEIGCWNCSCRVSCCASRRTASGVDCRSRQKHQGTASSLGSEQAWLNSKESSSSWEALRWVHARRNVAAEGVGVAGAVRHPS